MPKNASARSNDYFLERLRLERPDVLRDLNSGKHATAAAAFRAANLKKPRTRLQEMKNAWSKASPAECDEFKKFIGCTTPAAATPPVTAPFSTDRKLSPHVVAEINAIMLRRGIKMGAVLDELGFGRRNPSLGLALSHNTRVQSNVITALEKWIAADRAAVRSP